MNVQCYEHLLEGGSVPGCRLAGNISRLGRLFMGSGRRMSGVVELATSMLIQDSVGNGMLVSVNRPRE